MSKLVSRSRLAAAPTSTSTSPAVPALVAVDLWFGLPSPIPPS
jgi:hypothetical protein